MNGWHEDLGDGNPEEAYTEAETIDFYGAPQFDRYQEVAAAMFDEREHHEIDEETALLLQLDALREQMIAEIADLIATGRMFRQSNQEIATAIVDSLMTVEGPAPNTAQLRLALFEMEDEDNDNNND